jgi:multisubunit Na+/H+ antiporter MnhC subunit
MTDIHVHDVYLDISIDWLIVGSVVIGLAVLAAVVILAFQMKRRRR